MGLTPKYDIEEIDYGTTGWNGIQTANNEKLDSNIYDRLIYELGEDLAIYDAVYVKSDSKVWKARADGVKQPCIGLMVEAGSAAETDKRIQRIGEITNSGWSFSSIGQPVYLSSTVNGGVTQTPSSDNAQVLGIAITSTKLLLTNVNQADLLSDPPYIVGGGYSGEPTASLVLLRHPITPQEVTFPVSLTGSKMVAGTSATAETIFSIKNNGVEFGTATFAISGTVATFAGAGDKLKEDDILTMVAPGSPDATLADLGFSLFGTRSVGTTTTTSTTSSTSSTTSSSSSSSSSTSSTSSTSTSSTTTTTTA